MMKKIIAFLIFFAWVPVPGISAEKVVFVTVEKDIPPNVYQEDAEIVGIYPSIIRQVCERLDIEPEFFRYPWKRCIRYMKTGRADAVFPPIRTEERARFLYFPDEAMTSKKIAVFSLKENRIKVETLADLKGKIVGVNDGYSYGAQFDAYEGLNKDLSQNIDMQVEKLLNNRMDVAVSVESPFMFFAKKRGVKDQIERVYIISEVPSYVAFSKATGEKGRLLSEKFSRVLAELKKEGIVQKITDLY